MAELLLELLSEEIPARMQKGAEGNLARLLGKALEGAGLEHDAIETFSTPRRLIARVTGLPVRTPDISEERRGPRADAPAQAIEGFLKSAGVARKDCELREEKKGIFLYAVIARKGRATSEVLAELLPGLIGAFPWPKSMRWGTGDLRWVRPLSSVLCLFDGNIVPFAVEGIEAGSTTYGHRFMAPAAITLRDYVDYVAKLQKAYVILDAGERQLRIRNGAGKLARAKKLKLLDDPKLLEEVAGLVEWPVPLLGEFDKKFLDLPPEVLISEMRQHQKYFALSDSKGKLANKFIVVANIEGADEAVIAGNERVLAARFADAKFFWDKDRKTNLEDNLATLDGIIFHEKLGSVGDKARRMEALAGELAKFIPGCDAKKAKRAARLAKCDLVTGMVGEFPDLQGVMGGYYAAAEGEAADIALAIREHYAPQGPGDACPAAPLSIAAALADKIDTLVGFFAIDQKPTGSKDPYALRRAALGVIRLITENGLQLPLRVLTRKSCSDYADSDGWIWGAGKILQTRDAGALIQESPQTEITSTVVVEAEISRFFAERLKVQQRDAGLRHDLIDAVFSVEGEDDLLRLLARVTALQAFLATDYGEDLLAGYKRAVNIVRIEEKKDGCEYRGKVTEDDFKDPIEKKLWREIFEAARLVDSFLKDEDFEGVMGAVAALKPSIDTFLDNVTVNVDKSVEGHKEIRAARLNLLGKVREALLPVADFSKIEGA